MSFVDGTCTLLHLGWPDGRTDDVTNICAAVMRLEDKPNGALDVAFFAGDMGVVFESSGKTAQVPGGPSYLVVHRVTLDRLGGPPISVDVDGSCARSGGPGPMEVRCTALGVATAEFTTAGTPRRRAAP
jgi:hypothetical protein